MSVHQPQKAAGWLVRNYNVSLLAACRESDIGGPLPIMLHPEIEAFVLFGTLGNPSFASVATKLANLSGFPVMTRPRQDDPGFEE